MPKRLAFCVLSGLLLAILVLPFSPGEAAVATVCNGGFASPLTTGTYGDVIVPEGTASTPTVCAIFGSTSGVVRIEGNVTVGQDAELHVFGGVAISGNVQSTDAAHVVIEPSSHDPGGMNVIKGNVNITDSAMQTTLSSVAVGGSVQLEGNIGPITLAADSVGGEFQATDNPGPLNMSLNTIDGNVTLTGDHGGTLGDKNTILADLYCAGNSSPFALGTDVVLGSSEGQCSETAIDISSTDSGGNPMAGYYATVSQNGTLLESCFSPCSFPGYAGQTYQISLANYEKVSLARWSNGMGSVYSWGGVDSVTISSSVGRIASVNATGMYDTP
jgi:hypothetical protein